MRAKYFKELTSFLILLPIVFSYAILVVSWHDTAGTGCIAEASASTAENPLSTRWDLERIQASQAWQTTAGKQDILVAVLDTGIDSSHQALNGQIVASVNFSRSPTETDRLGHGTHVAGIIAARPGIHTGIVGLARDCRLLNAKVANDDGSTDAPAVAKGITWAVDNGASVINISVAINQPSPSLEEAVNYAWKNGRIIIAAAGNDPGTRPVYPAAYQNVIAVAATDVNDQIMKSSNRGGWVDISAPGSNIYSALPDNRFAYKSGTSMAAALVSAEAALLYGLASDTNRNEKVNDEVRSAIQSNTEPVRTAGFQKGRINVFSAVAALVPQTLANAR